MIYPAYDRNILHLPSSHHEKWTPSAFPWHLARHRRNSHLLLLRTIRTRIRRVVIIIAVDKTLEAEAAAAVGTGREVEVEVEEGLGG